MFTGKVKKLQSILQNTQISYFLPLNNESIDLKQYFDKKIRLSFTGKIFCANCNRLTKKSYSQGFCFPCMKKLACCDMCIVKPELCHYDKGTCREPHWGEKNCMTNHIVYLSNTSGLKVGITRGTQIPTRWIDQGAIQALPIIEVSNRQLSGLIEVEISKFISDKTNWRVMLKEEPEKLDLKQISKEIILKIQPKLDELRQSFGNSTIKILNEEMVSLDFPINQHPKKINSFNFDKTPIIEGVLKGIKGQYLIFDNGVLNIRKFSSYEVNFEELKPND